MRPEFAGLWTLVGAVACLDVLVALAVLRAKSVARRRYRTRTERMRRLNLLVLEADGPGLAAEYRLDPWATVTQLRLLLESARPRPEARLAIGGILSTGDFLGRAGKAACSHALHRRIEAYLALGLSPDPRALDLLLGALPREARRLGRLCLLRSVAVHGATPDAKRLAAGLGESRRLEALRRGGRGPVGGATAAARRRELAAMRELGPRLKPWFESEEGPLDGPLLELYLMAARSSPSEADWQRLSGIALAHEGAAGDEAASILAECFPVPRFLEAFGARPERRFSLLSARLLGASLGLDGLSRLHPWFDDPDLREAGIAAAAEVLRRHAGGEEAFLAVLAAESGARAACLAEAVAHRLPFLVYHSRGYLSEGLKAAIRSLLDAGRTGSLLAALAATMPKESRTSFLEFLRAELSTRPETARGLSRHLDGQTRAALGIAPAGGEADRPRIPVSPGDKAFLAVLVLLGLALFPAAFVAIHGGELAWMTPAEILYRFIFDFQYLFAYYTIVVNGIYLALLGLSAAKLRSQALLWERGLGNVLGASGALPKVSIIAPAFNEEPTIAESLHSLLGLSYPDYEVIVVNDGSTDGTLRALVEGFSLEPSDPRASGALPTMPVRGLYRSPALPNLVVVDKANGGKADALNAGLNQARGEYVCTIDADSILDPQALTRAMLQVVSSGREVLAIGGNIFPVNGCVVEHGHLQEISLPTEPLARFQTIEYLRSFVSGRLGWTMVDSLLIISGAFGLFRRDAVMELGGYLTGSGALRHDTVGEDMEIVVRLKRADREKGGRGKIDYAYNANCWTEVPEDRRTLFRQRDRWHRGLMEVLCLHRGMTFRPRYGAAGLVALPYFFLFELVGPWLEVLGYLVLALALALNLIDPLVPLLVFSIAVAFGVLVSIASLRLAERQILYFRTSEFLKLLGVAIIENFGFRQVMSMSRVKANFMFFFSRKGWQKGTRRGFARAASAAGGRP